MTKKNILNKTFLCSLEYKIKKNHLTNSSFIPACKFV